MRVPAPDAVAAVALAGRPPERAAGPVVWPQALSTAGSFYGIARERGAGQG